MATNDMVWTCTGDWHRAAHVWIYVMDTHQLLLQKRSNFKDSWGGKWDISAAGHGMCNPPLLATYFPSG
jgi:isopentenyldiphosphate isomerase